MVDLDGYRLVVAAGDARGVVIRCPGAVLVARPTRPGTQAVMAQLLALCGEAAEAGQPSESSARALVRRVAGVLAGAEPEDVPDFALLVSSGERLAALVHGSTDVVASGEPGEIRLSGAESATWLDRLLPPGLDRIEIGPTSVVPAPSNAWPDVPFPLDLRSGVIAGTGAVLLAGGGTFGGRAVSAPAASASAGAAVSTPPSSDGIGDPAHPRTPAGAAAGPAAPPIPAGSWPSGPVEKAWQPEPERAWQPKPAEKAWPPEAENAWPPEAEKAWSDSGRESTRDPEWTPDPADVDDVDQPTELGGEAYADPVTELAGGGRLAEPEEAATELGGSGEPQIQGILCPQGHFNNPGLLYCAECDAPLSHQQSVWGPRPALGVLVFDDGSTVPLDTDIVIGRQPERDDAVRAGRARPLVVEDGESAVSRVHASIRLDGWDATIVDHGSANGTYIAPPEATTWTPLTAHQPSPLTSGTRVQVGKRTFVFDTRRRS